MVVTELIGEAVGPSGEGRLPDLAGLLAGLTQASEAAEAADPGNAELVDALVGRIRSTPLDPARPGPDLLEGLLAGIRACARLYQDYEADLADGFAGVTDPVARRSGPPAVFIAAVRAQAGTRADQL